MNIIHQFRTIFRGDVPLVAAEKDLNSFRARENLDDQSTTYVRRVLNIIKKQGKATSVHVITFGIHAYNARGEYAHRVD